MASVMSQNIQGLRGTPGLNPAAPQNDRSGKVDSSIFRDQLAALQNGSGAPAAGATTGPGALKFSNHAIDRMQSRGIRFSPDEMMRIEGAIKKAEGKGAKDTLLLTDNSALIVSVKDKTVVTVMDKASLKDNVFTKIDSTVVI